MSHTVALIEFALVMGVVVILALLVASQIAPAVGELWEGIAWEIGQALS